jgi:hypothetical protein
MKAFSLFYVVLHSYRQSLGAELVEPMLVIRLNREYPAGHDVRTLTESLKEMIEEETTQETAVDSLTAVIEEGTQAERCRHWGREQLRKRIDAMNPKKGQKR